MARGSRRSSIDILISILKFVEERGYALKTHILYHANLNSRSLEKFLKTLVASGLIDRDRHDGRETYRVTMRGKMFLKHVSAALSMLNNDCPHIRKLSTSNNNIMINEGISREGVSGAMHVLKYVVKVKNDGSEVYVDILCGNVSMNEAVSALGTFYMIMQDLGMPGILIVPSHMKPGLDALINKLEKRNKSPQLMIFGMSRYESPTSVLIRALEALKSQQRSTYR